MQILFETYIIQKYQAEPFFGMNQFRPHVLLLLCPRGLPGFADSLRNQSIHTMPVGNPAAVAVKDLFPAGMEQPVVIISKELPGIPGVPQFLILRILKRTGNKRLLNKYIQGIDAHIRGM